VGRGVHEKTKIKKDIKYAAKATAAAEVAATEAKYKTLNKFLPERIQEALIACIEKIDPLEVAAIGGMAFLIKPVIQKIPEVANYLASNLPFGLDLAVESFQDGEIVIFEIKNPFTGEIIWKYSIPVEGSEPVNTDVAQRIPDLNAWILAIVISIIVIKYPEVLKMAENGVVGVAKLIAGVGA